MEIEELARLSVDAGLKLHKQGDTFREGLRRIVNGAADFEPTPE